MILIIFSEFFIMHGVFAIDGDIVITEVMYNSGDNTDWFEIFNKGINDINLKNLYLIDEFDLVLNSSGDKYLNCHNVNKDDYFLKAGNFSVIGKNSGDFVLKSLDLNGVNKDSVRLSFDNCKSFIGEIVYNPKENKIKKDYSLELDKNYFWRESFVLGGTPGKTSSEDVLLEKNENIITGEIIENDKNDNFVRINEIFPNPKNENDEFIELYNFSNKAINLKNWIIKDASKGSGYVFKEGDVIGAKGYFVVVREDSKLSFNNTGLESVYLIDSVGVERDRISYSGTKEGLSYGFDEMENKWRWSEFLTPGNINKFEKIGKVTVKMDDHFYKDIYANFEVHIFGIKDEKLKVKWEFGDEKKSYLAKTKHKYIKNGRYIIKLMVSGGTEDVEKEFKIKVESFPKRKISILAINPNPKGKDIEGEWIDLKNKSNKKVNLKNWSIATGVNKKKLINHPINNDFIIKAGKTERLTRKFSNFSLNNKSNYIELRYPNGEVAYDMKYKKEKGIRENEIYSKKEGGWEWIIIASQDLKDMDNKAEDGENMSPEEELVEIRDVDLIREMTIEDIGKYSGEKKDNIIKSFPVKYLANIQEKNKDISRDNRYVLGTWDNKIKKIRNEGNIYYFNPEIKNEKNYLWIVWNNINSFLGSKF
ncbi:MAG: lamin tail domain-containing protein [Parcubacteria group bacterium]